MGNGCDDNSGDDSDDIIGLMEIVMIDCGRDGWGGDGDDDDDGGDGQSYWVSGRSKY
jgi:hypothetical protein